MKPNSTSILNAISAATSNRSQIQIQTSSFQSSSTDEQSYET